MAQLLNYLIGEKKFVETNNKNGGSLILPKSILSELPVKYTTQNGFKANFENSEKNFRKEFKPFKIIGPSELMENDYNILNPSINHNFVNNNQAILESALRPQLNLNPSINNNQAILESTLKPQLNLNPNTLNQSLNINPSLDFSKTYQSIPLDNSDFRNNQSYRNLSNNNLSLLSSQQLENINKMERPYQNEPINNNPSLSFLNDSYLNPQKQNESLLLLQNNNSFIQPQSNRIQNESLPQNNNSFGPFIQPQSNRIQNSNYDIYSNKPQNLSESIYIGEPIQKSIFPGSKIYESVYLDSNLQPLISNPQLSNITELLNNQVTYSNILNSGYNRDIIMKEVLDKIKLNEIMQNECNNIDCNKQINVCKERIKCELYENEDLNNV